MRTKGEATPAQSNAMFSIRTIRLEIAVITPLSILCRGLGCANEAVQQHLGLRDIRRNRIDGLVVILSGLAQVRRALVSSQGKPLSDPAIWSSAKIIAQAVARLRPNRFAVWVIGDVRDADGFFVNLPGLTVEAFEAAGARFYNDAILVTAVGSLPIRVGRQFTAARKLGRTHKNVLVFCKGDPRKATEACGPVEFGEIEGPDNDGEAPDPEDDQ